jgi:hypothetical protein
MRNLVNKFVLVAVVGLIFCPEAVRETAHYATDRGTETALDIIANVTGRVRDRLESRNDYDGNHISEPIGPTLPITP